MQDRDDALDFVLDYPAMGRPKTRPGYLHRKDCWHPAVDSTWRRATPQERATLPKCASCLATEADLAIRARRPEDVAAATERMRSGERPRLRFPGE